MAAQKATEFVTLKRYLAWAVREGCRVQSGFMTGPDGMISFIVVTAPSGQYAVIEDVDRDEALPVAAFKHYDRRLGMQSPFGNTKH